MLSRCPVHCIRHRILIHPKCIYRSFLIPFGVTRRLFSLASCDIDPDVQNAITNRKMVLPLDTSPFVFGEVSNRNLCTESGVEENISCIRSQVDSARRLNVIAAPVALIEGRVFQNACGKA